MKRKYTNPSFGTVWQRLAVVEPRTNARLDSLQLQPSNLHSRTLYSFSFVLYFKFSHESTISGSTRIITAFGQHKSGLHEHQILTKTCTGTSKPLHIQLLTLLLPRKDWFFETLSRSHGDVRCLVAHQIVTSIRDGLVTLGGATPYRLSDEDALTRARLLMAAYFYVCHSNAWSYRPSIALPSPTVKLSLFRGPIKQGQS